MTREFIDGAQAICRGAIDSGCNFFAGYPITPASGILALMMKHLPAHGGICMQGEDEIASIGFCISAAMTGRRALTATSGPGMSLYSENLGLAIMGEVPLVIVNVQRLGPSTGAATTSSEGDIQFVQWATSGGTPMVVLSPIDIPSTYWLTTYAFKISEKLRIPVILNTSKDLVMTLETVDNDDFKQEQITSRKYFSGNKEFLPSHFEDPNQPPEFLPVGANQQVRFTSSMHDEHCVLTKNPKKTGRLVEHFAQKVLNNRKEFELYDWIKTKGAKNLIIAHGVSARLAKSCLKRLEEKDSPTDLLILYSLWPTPEEIILEASQDKDCILIPEHNLGLYRREIERLVPREKVTGINRVDGELITEEQIIGRLL